MGARSKVPLRRQPRPVEPKPPAPRAVSLNVVTTSHSPCVTGAITIDAERNARKPAVVLQVKGGKYAFAASIQPQQ